MLEPDFPGWQRILVLEALKSFCLDPSLLLFFFARYDQQGPALNVFGNLNHALARFVQASSFDKTAQAGGRSLYQRLTQERVRAKTKGLDMLSETAPPAYDPIYSVTLSLDALVAVVEALQNLANECLAANVDTREHKESKDSNPRVGSARTGLEEKNSHQKNADPRRWFQRVEPSIELVREMVNTAYTPLLAALSFLLSKCDEEGQLQYLLMTFQAFTNTCGQLGLARPRQALLTSLCLFALPKTVPSPEVTPLAELLALAEDCGSAKPLLSGKNVQALKALFNIAHCLGDWLADSWALVLETFGKLQRALSVSNPKSPNLPNEATLPTSRSLRAWTRG
jgi:hypothetical protein